MNHLLQEPLNWQVTVNRIVTTESPERLGRLGILTSAEMDEAHKAHLSGISAEDFATTIVLRDKMVEKPVPIDFPKPLSPDDSTIIRLLTDMYVGIDQPLVKGETEDRVTLHVPRIKRVFKEVGAV